MDYIYLPVGSDEMLEFADDWNDQRRIRGEEEMPIIATTSSGKLKAIRRLCGRGNLRFVGNTDTLFVIIHGHSQGSRFVGADRGGHKDSTGPVPKWVGGTEKKWTPEEFAGHLAGEGLVKDFQDLRLVVCGSALKAKKARSPYAAGLFAALRARGYASVRVTGYLGATRFSPEYGLTVEYAEGRGYQLRPAQDYSVTWA